MKPTIHPIRKPPASPHRGAALIAPLTGRLVLGLTESDSVGGLFQVQKLGKPSSRVNALARWTKAGQPTWFAASELALPIGALARVTLEDVSLALAAIAREHERRSPESAKRLHALRRWLRNQHQDKDHPCVRYQWIDWRIELERHGDHFSFADRTWEDLLHWYGSDDALGHWKAARERLGTNWSPQAWHANARRTVALLDQYILAVPKMHPSNRYQRGHELFLRIVELSKPPHNLKVTVDYPDWFQSRSTATRWAKRSRQELATLRQRSQEWSRATLPAMLASWIAIDPVSPPGWKQVLTWMEENREDELQQLMQVADEVSDRELRRLLAVGSLLTKVPQRFWSNVATSPLSNADLKRNLDDGEFYMLSRPSRSPSVVQRIFETTGAWMGPGGGNMEASVYLAWLAWAAQFHKARWTADRCERWRGLLSQVNDLCLLMPELKRRWSGWFRSFKQATQLAAPAAKPLDRVDDHTADQARSLIIARKFGEHDNPWPQSIATKIQLRAQWVREIQCLSEREQLGQLSDSAQKRLKHLQSQSLPNLPPLRSLRGRITMSTISAMADAACIWAQRRRDEYLQQIGFVDELIADAGYPEDTKAQTQRKTEFVGFLAGLPQSSRKALIAALQAAQGETTGYKRLGSKNGRWLGKATRAGVNMDAWLDPSPTTIQVPSSDPASQAAEAMNVQLTSLARWILWMGRPFDSCLDLCDGIYSQSVVPNFMDANKQLLILIDRQGRMVGRKLLAISSENQLIGYRLYLASCGNHEMAWSATETAVNNYCCELANRVGIPLANEGTPQRLHGNSWYDDCTVAWD